jgi:hypothetical protein
MIPLSGTYCTLFTGHQMSDGELIKVAAFISYQNFILLNKTCQLIGTVLYFVTQIAYILSESDTVVAA